ncbi:Peptidyl-prolyl isomerase cwc27 [Xylographa trunciseda]|nr:Peptidyl-prolyl isomerase cwc27 [Xylographa trunciseda]
MGEPPVSFKRRQAFGQDIYIASYEDKHYQWPTANRHSNSDMSALYNLEPQPTAKVLLQTTSGDILLELFAKQTPLTSRNFLQLCLDGYYNGTIFHRLVPGFIVQGGDPTGTGEGGEAIYDGGLFADEFHSRLKFNRRGLLGMANSGRKDDNRSQFFLTLGTTEELNGRNTMFGRVVGDTIYNLMKMGEADLMDGEGNERPLYPTMITKTDVLVNPFDDLVARVPKAKTAGKEDKGLEKKKNKRKTGKTLLSFGGEDGQDVEETPVLKKTKFNTKLVSAPDTANSATNNHKEDLIAKPKEVKPLRSQHPSAISPPPRQNSHPEFQLPLRDEERPSRSPSASPEPEQVEKVPTLLERTNAQIAELKASMKRNIPAASSGVTRKKSALEQMIPENSTRGRKRKQGRKIEDASDAQALQLLNAFRAKLDKAPAEALPLDSSLAQEDEVEQPVTNGHDIPEEDDEAHLCDLHFIANCQSCRSWDKALEGTVDDDDNDDGAWMSHVLSFEKDRLGKDLTWKRKNEEELVVIDPREKAKEIKDEQRAKRAANNVGSSSKAWDRDRDRGRLPGTIARERG